MLTERSFKPLLPAPTWRSDQGENCEGGFKESEFVLSAVRLGVKFEEQ